MTMTKMKMALGGMKIESPFEKYVHAAACLKGLLATTSHIDILASSLELVKCPTASILLL